MTDANRPPLFRSHMTGKVLERFDVALSLMDQAASGHPVTESALKDCRRHIHQALESVWEKTIEEPFFHGGRCSDRSEPVQDLFYAIHGPTLHGWNAQVKRIQKTAALPGLNAGDRQALDAMLNIDQQMRPLVQISAQASLVLEQRKAQQEQQQQQQQEGNGGNGGNGGRSANAHEPHKKTCPCCFRGIALQPGGFTMAHHGYRRPGLGWQTASCPGVRFRPLEVSSEGLQWLVSTMKDRVHKLEDALNNPQSPLRPTRLPLPSRPGMPAQMIESGHPDWERMLFLWEKDKKQDLRMFQASLPDCEERLAQWVPSESEDAATEAEANESGGVDLSPHRDRPRP